jgi:hypothetical protein
MEDGHQHNSNGGAIEPTRVEIILDRVNDALSSYADEIDARFWVSVLILTAVSVLASVFLILWAGPMVPNSDGITYFMKAREIVRGNWTPVISHEIGWPIFMAPVVGLVKGLAVERQTQILMMYCALWGSLSIIPLAWISRSWLGRVWMIAGPMWAAFILRYFRLTAKLATEPIFVVLILGSLILILGRRTAPRVALCGALVGLTCWIRPNGVFLIPAIMVIYIFRGISGKQLRNVRYWLLMVVMIGTTLLVVAPKNMLRNESLRGQLLHYGRNSLYLTVNSIERVWTDNPPPARQFGQYFAETTPADWFDKFVIHGAYGAFLGFMTILGSVNLPFTLLFVAGILALYRHHALAVMLTIFGFWLAGLSVVWQVHHTPRYWWPTAPFVVVLCSAGTVAILARQRLRYVWTAILLGLIGLHAAMNGAQTAREFAARPDPRPVSSWINKNVQGILATSRYSWSIAVFNSDMTAGGLPHENYQSKTLKIIKMPYVDTLRQFFDHEKRRGVSHMMIDDWPFGAPSPALEKLHECGGNSGRLTVGFLDEIYESHSQPRLLPVRVYRINWDKYDAESVN